MGRKPVKALLILFLGLSVAMGLFFVVSISGELSQEDTKELLAQGGHGVGSSALDSSEVSLITLDEVYANVSNNSPSTHSSFMVAKLNLELFSETDRDLIEKYQSPIRDVVIQTSRERNYEDLTTIAGKLYFKELLAARINELLNKPAIRKLHFASFYVH